MTHASRLVAEPSRCLSTQTEVCFSGLRAKVKQGSTEAPFTVMEISAEKGAGAPAHISPEEDKCFVVTSGFFYFLIGDERRYAEAGDVIFVARGEVHSFSGVGDEANVLVLVSTPSHHHDFFIAMAGLKTPHDPQEVNTVCERLNQQIVGPIVTPPEFSQ